MEAAEPEPVLVLNCGSSSVKFAVLDPETGQSWLGGLVERVGTPDARMTSSRNGQTRTETPTDTSYSGVLRAILGHLADLGDLSLLGVGHRVVHGGERFTESVVIDDDVLSAIRGTSHLAPLHNPANLEGIARRAGGAARRAAGGGLRHRVSPQHAAPRLPLRDPADVVPRARRAPVRLSRDQPPLRRRARGRNCWDARSTSCVW